MEIISSNINSDSIDLVTYEPVARLVLNYGIRLENEYTEDNINSTTLSITKEALGLKTLDNTYFKLEIYDTIDSKAAIGLYNIEILNNLESKLYDANTLKQELDNLNYYDNILISLTQKLDFFTANDFFFNYINFLKKKLNGNNILQYTGKQNRT